MFRRAVCAVATAALVPVALVSSAGAVDPHSPSWSVESSGWNRSSSPVIADIDGDGKNEVVVGHQDGMLRAYEADGSLKWAAAAVPGVGPGCNGQATASAIDSSPAVADLDADGRPEVIVGVGSTWRANQNGGVVAFDGVTGAREWGTAIGRDMGNVWADTGVKDGWCEGVYATPAIGDVDGDGHLDVVFAAWDFYIWAVDRFGNPLPGFPFDNDDSVWSSPALFDVDNDGDMEIFIGGDTWPGGLYDHQGGVFRALDWTPNGVVNLWNRDISEVFHSSPAIGDIDFDGRYEVVVGTGEYWHASHGSSNGDHRRVFAFHLDDGSSVPGFPVETGGTVMASPALGDLDGDGRLEVVVGSADRKVYAWNGDGSLLWSTTPEFAHLGTGRMQGAPIIADLDGDGDQDVAIGGDLGLALLDGATGASLEEGLIWQHRMAVAWSFEAAPAVGVLNGTRHLVYSGFDTPQNKSRLAAFPLPATEADDDWPMFRHDAQRQGVTTVGACGEDSGRVFCDVLPGDYFEAAVAWMVDAGITTGISDTLYGPHLSLTRAQMVTFLWREAGAPTGYPAHGFGDVPAGAYYDDAVRWARATGITTGTSEITFSPGQTVTRGQLVTLLWRRADSPAATPPPVFTDVAPGRYYSAAVGWAKGEGITNGTSATTFSPDAAVTRAQAAAFLYRAAGSPAYSGRVRPPSEAGSPAY